MFGLRRSRSIAMRLLTKTADVLRDTINIGARFVALIVLTVYLPALMLAALAILASSAGPAFVERAYRTSQGSVVYLYELRTECSATGRITPAGRMLIQLDIVRLPRLANVLLGQIAAGARVERLG